MGLVLTYKSCSSHVSRNHALFNKLVGIISFKRLYPLNFHVLIKDKVKFFTFNRNTASVNTVFLEQLIKIVKFLNIINDSLMLFKSCCTLANHLPGLVIGQTGMRTHNCWIKTIIVDITVFVDYHFTGHAQSVHIRI